MTNKTHDTKKNGHETDSFDSLEQCQHHLQLMLKATQREFIIISRALPDTLFGEEGFIKALTQFTLAHRYSHCKVLLLEDTNIHLKAHSLLALAQRLPSKITIKKLKAHVNTTLKEQCLFDDRQQLVFDNANKYRGNALYHASPQVKQERIAFTELWELQSEADPNLQILHI